MSALLAVRNVSWQAGARAVLSGITFDVSAGECVALMGKNGAGKSTLLDIIAGLRQAAGGDVRIDDRDTRSWPAAERARCVAHLPQAVHADIALDVEQFVLMGRYPHADTWFDSDDDRSGADAAMIECDCLAFRHRRMSTLSGGERQRVLLAACLAQRPRLLLLDEPATFLDVDQQLQCFEILRRLTTRGAACVAVTHDINLALTFCTRLIVLDNGTIAHDMPVARALDDTAWLARFSPRLAVTRTPDGRPWICVQ